MTVDDGGLRRTVPLDDDGGARFAPVETDRLSVAFEQPVVRGERRPADRWRQPLGIGVSELEVGGPNPAPPPETPVASRAGVGPDVQVDGVVLQTAATTTLGALTEVRPIPLEICSGAPGSPSPRGSTVCRARAGQLLAPDRSP